MGAKSPPVYFLGFETCPRCRETIFAAEAAEIEVDCIRYRWTCDLCGHSFTTQAELVPAEAA